MNKVIAVLALSLVSFASSFAGGFGGPPPFTNGSPLPTGVDGSYVGAVSGSNMSGVIAFQYSSGVQSGVVARNTWVIFYQGQVYRGVTDVAIADGRISGVLGTSTAAPVSRTNSSSSSNATAIVGPPNFNSTSSRIQSETIASLANPSGFFNAKLNNNSPTGSFKGTGMLEGVFSTTATATTTGSSSGTGIPTVTVTEGPNTTLTTQTISAPFRVNGVRARTGA